MTDLYLQISHSPVAGRIVSSLGLPVPPTLKRSTSPWPNRVLEDQSVVIGGPEGKTSDAIVGTLNAAGAALYCAQGQPISDSLQQAAAIAGCTLQTLSEAEGTPRPNALVFDATGLSGASGLRALYDFFNPLLPKLKSNARIVLIAGLFEHGADLRAATAARAVEGFCRSLAKEIGKKGSTVQLLYVQPGAEDRISGPLRFFLSPYSAYVTGQALRVTQVVKSSAQPRWVAPLEGKVALVTGAARGIGASIAETLAREGAKVVCLDRPAEQEHLAKVAEKIGGSTILTDITDANAPQVIADALKKEFSGVDIVIHNAGVTRDKTLARMSPEWWDMVLGINLDAIMRINDALLQQDVIRNDGRIVCLSSISGVAGNAGQTNYSTSKAGLIGYVDALSREVAGKGITVNAVAPGFIETQMTAAIPFAIREVGRRLNSLSQGGLPQDVAEVITMFASPGAVGVTGQTLRICGQSLVGA